jgi:hypothetical protein
MIRLYSYLEDMIESRQLYDSKGFDHKLYLSDLMVQLRINDNNKMEATFERALAVMSTSGVAADDHIRMVYRNDGFHIKKDISLSPLAAQLMVINSDCSNEYVARAQVFIMEKL